MASLLVKAEQLSQDDVLLLPFGRTATIKTVPKIGRQFVSFRTEFGASRLALGQEVFVEARVAE